MRNVLAGGVSMVCPTGFALALLVECLTGAMVGPLLSAQIPDMFRPADAATPQRIAHLLLAYRSVFIRAGQDVPLS